MPTYTRQEVREELIDRYGVGRRGTNSGIVTTSITDVEFAGQGAEDIDVGSQVMITSGGAAPEDEIRQLSTRPHPTTGLMSVSRVFTVALANEDTFDALHPRFRFDGGPFSLHEAINKAVADFAWERRLVPVTMIPDGDMLKATYADWTASAGGTASKSAASFPYGQRGVVCAATSPSNVYLYGANLGVDENETYFFQVTGQLSIASASLSTLSAKIILYDLTNSADIALDEETIEQTEPIILTNSAVSIPSGCRYIQPRLNLTTGTGAVYALFGDVILRPNSAREFLTQDRDIRVLDIGRVFATNEQDWTQRGKSLEDDEIEATVQQLGAGLWQIRVASSVAGKSVWYEEFVRASALDDDADTTTIPKEDLAAVAAELLLAPLARDPRWGSQYQLAARDAAKARQRYAALSVVRVETQHTYPLRRV